MISGIIRRKAASVLIKILLSFFFFFSFALLTALTESLHVILISGCVLVLIQCVVSILIDSFAVYVLIITKGVRTVSAED